MIIGDRLRMGLWESELSAVTKISRLESNWRIHEEVRMGKKIKNLTYRWFWNSYKRHLRGTGLVSG